MSGYEVVHVDELANIHVADGLVWHPVRERFNIRSFGVNAYTAEAVGGHVVEEHDELGGGTSGHEELYLVVRGRARFTVAGETFDAPEGTFVYLADPTLRRAAIAEEADTIVLAIGGEPGRPFEVSPWEANFLAIPALREGRYDEAIATISKGLEEHPGHPSLLYNLACAESLGGRPLDALLHLQEAVRVKPELAGRARTDPDFAAIRREQGFPA